jgi:RND family efflux transporter MFP subunit
VHVHVGDIVRAGQALGEMDPVDLEERIDAQGAARKRAEANVLAAEAQIQDATARTTFAEKQAMRYEQLLEVRAVSAEAAEMKRQDRRIAQAGLTAMRANLDAARQELARARADHAGLIQQRVNLRLTAPADGLVTARNADPGTTVVAGQSVVEVIDTANIWINVRLDQLRARGLRAGLPAQIVLRSQAGQSSAGKILRVEPLADAVTEETLAKIVFDDLPQPLPPIGELAEVTIALPALPAIATMPTASIQRVGGRPGVWVIDDGSLRFTPVKIGAADLDGQVQIAEGLQSGQHVVVYSRRALDQRSRIKVVEHLPDVLP